MSIDDHLQQYGSHEKVVNRFTRKVAYGCTYNVAAKDNKLLYLTTVKLWVCIKNTPVKHVHDELTANTY
jgi:hypothetical protein